MFPPPPFSLSLACFTVEHLCAHVVYTRGVLCATCITKTWYQVLHESEITEGTASATGFEKRGIFGVVVCFPVDNIFASSCPEHKTRGKEDNLGERRRSRTMRPRVAV